jgi:hypothetical protein
MKESYVEGLATHNGPESCGATRKGSVEALTGEGMGRVLSRERVDLRDADVVGCGGRQYQVHRNSEMALGPARSETLSTYGNTSHENREVLCLSAAGGVAGRVGKSKDVRRR